MSLYFFILSTLVLPAFISCPSSPPVPLLLRTYPPPRPTPPLLSPLSPLSQSPPAPTTSNKPRHPTSEHIAHRGLESVVLPNIVWLYSSYFWCKPQSLQNPPPPSLPPAEDNPTPPPPTPPPWLPPIDPSREPVLEASQGLLHTGGQDPRLQSEKQHCLDDLLCNVNVNVDLWFRISCELVGWLTILGFPVNLSGDWLFPNIKRWEFSTTKVVGEGESVCWGGTQTKVEMHECKLIINMFLHGDLLQMCLNKKRKITDFFPDTTFFMIKKSCCKLMG